VIGTPVINTRAREIYRDTGTVQLVWQGYRTNAGCMERLHPVIEKINGDSAGRLRLVYHCDRPPDRAGDPGIRFIQWRISNWEDVLVSSDIGVVIKPADDVAQQQKPPTKVISYMAAGLPVVCSPSAADRQVIEHGRTGYFAESDDEWYELLIRLGEDARLRERIGRAGREQVLERFGADTIAAEYLAYVDALREAHPKST
jgi:glycosyltransferase involved in cell wall biosynthesis